MNEEFGQFEDLIEQLYWEFDYLRSKREMSERDAFKWTLRNNFILCTIPTKQEKAINAEMKQSN